MKFGAKALFAAKEIAGTATAAATVVQNNNSDVVVLEDNFRGNTDNLTVVSESYLFDAAYDGKKTTLTRKDFAEVEQNASLAAYLEENYTAGNNTELYNNLKGEIVGISTTGHSIFFTLKVHTVLSDFDIEGTDIEYVSPGECGTTIIRIEVEDEDDDDDSDTGSGRGVVPFQIAYAVSIHKAQGLEYRSVKIVITHDVEDLITHNIFYTAVTRTREKLKIYWTPESENKILKNMRFQFCKKDYGILRNKYHDF